VVVLGDCDEGVKKLADALGWRDELESMWLEVGGKVREKEAARLREQRQAMSQDEILEAEIEKLTGEVDAALKMSKDHEERVITQLEKSSSNEISTSASPASSDDIPSGTIMTKEESKDHLSSGQSTASSEVPTKSEGGWKEPPSTPAIGENTPPTTENVNKELPSAVTQADRKVIVDVTLPHQRPNTLVPESESDQNKTPSRI
jgi:NAD-dependent histone deacetylase SIR2